MPTSPDSRTREKSTTESAPWGTRIHYTFQEEDKEHSTEEVYAYRLPYSKQTFWTDFRVCAFQANGMILPDPIRVQIVVQTADGSRSTLLPWCSCSPQRWASTRWAIPSLFFPLSAPSAVWFEIMTNQTKEVRLELQGFQAWYPESDRYFLVDEQDKRQFLFQQERAVVVSPAQPSTGSIHEIYHEEQVPTHGVDPLEAVGVTLFPLHRA
jgi:hypothetical protein